MAFTPRHIFDYTYTQYVLLDIIRSFIICLRLLCLTGEERLRKQLNSQKSEILHNDCRSTLENMNYNKTVRHRRHIYTYRYYIHQGCIARVLAFIGHFSQLASCFLIIDSAHP